MRVAAHDLIGNVRVIEESEHIIAEIDGGRLLMLGATPDVTYGAQDTLPDLYIERIPLRLK